MSKKFNFTTPFTDVPETIDTTVLESARSKKQNGTELSVEEIGAWQQYHDWKSANYAKEQSNKFKAMHRFMMDPASIEIAREIFGMGSP